jgi:hypothetical protein
MKVSYVPAFEEISCRPGVGQRRGVERERSEMGHDPAADFHEQGIQNLVQHFDKCLNGGGDYGEKSTKVCRI